MEEAEAISGISWAERIEDEGRREEALEKIARAWLHKDSDAARSWLDSGALSDVVVERVYAAHERIDSREKQRKARQRARGEAGN